MPRHQVATRLARFFHVIWMNPAQEWRRAIFHSRIDGKRPPAGIATAGFKIHEPEIWLPKIYRPDFLARWTAGTRIRRAMRVLRREGCERIVFYIWRPNFAEALDLAEPDLGIYHIDDEYSFLEVEVPITNEEASLIRRADQVFIHSPALMEKKGRLNPRTAFVPNGVDFDAYACPAVEPEGLRAIPHPRIGYVGVIKKYLDFKLMIEIARRHPEWSFVLVGPPSFLEDREGQFKELLQLSNVRWLGGKPVEELPAYTQHLDVCLMPYLVNNYTKYIYPLKLHEYLGCGRPVVGSPIRTLLDYAGVISLAQSVDEWETAIGEALAPAALSADKIAERRRIARRHDWDLLVLSIARTICKRFDISSLEHIQEPQGLVKTVSAP